MAGGGYHNKFRFTIKQHCKQGLTMNNSQLGGQQRMSENNWKSWKKSNDMFEGTRELSGQ